MATPKPVASSSSVPSLGSVAEKPRPVISWFPDHVLFSPLNRAIAKFDEWREELKLPEPGTYEAVGREVKAVHLTNYTFDGGRAELSKALSLNPAFNVTHTFSIGGQGGPLGGVNSGTYQFGAMYATNKVFAQASVDNDKTLMGRFNYGWSPRSISKLQVQWPSSPSSPSVSQLEHECRGSDFTLSFKAYNPQLSDLSGIYIAQYLQSLHPRFAIGIEAVWQRQPPLEDAQMSYVARWAGAKRDWVATASAQATGVLQTSYWQKLAERVEAGADLVVIPHPVPRERKALATLGVKYELRQSLVRGQVDSMGKVGMLLEHRIAPTFTFLVAGEIDHIKSTSKFGVGIQLETSPLDEASMQNVTPPSPPM